MLVPQRCSLIFSKNYLVTCVYYPKKKTTVPYLKYLQYYSNIPTFATWWSICDVHWLRCELVTSHL